MDYPTTKRCLLNECYIGNRIKRTSLTCRIMFILSLIESNFLRNSLIFPPSSLDACKIISNLKLINNIDILSSIIRHLRNFLTDHSIWIFAILFNSFLSSCNDFTFSSFIFHLSSFVVREDNRRGRLKKKKISLTREESGEKEEKEKGRRVFRACARTCSSGSLLCPRNFCLQRAHASRSDRHVLRRFLPVRFESCVWMILRAYQAFSLCRGDGIFSREWAPPRAKKRYVER